MESIIIECLDLLDRGEPIGEILARYPLEAMELRPILDTAARLSVMNLQPTLIAQTKSRELFLAQARALKGLGGGTKRRSLFSLLLRPLATLALLIILGIGFVGISEKSLPGDTLYGAKMLIEETQASFWGNDENLAERFRQNRIAEIQALLEQNREASVTFQGLVDEVQTGDWRIEGMPVTVSAAEFVGGDAQVGDMVEVMCWVKNGRIIASRVALIQKGETPLLPEPTSTPSVVPTDEPTPLPTATPTIVTETPTFTSTNTPTATSTATSTPTVTPSSTVIPPTFTPVPTDTPLSTPYEHEGESDDDPDDPEEPDDNSGSGSSNSGSGSGGDDDNSGSGSSNSGSGSGSDDDNSGSGSSNSGSGSNNSGSGSGGSDDD